WCLLIPWGSRATHPPFPRTTNSSSAHTRHSGVSARENDVAVARRVMKLLTNPGVTNVAVLALALGSGTSVTAAEEFPTNPGFSIQRQGETACLVRPNGERFFSLGVCCVSQGASRKEFDPANPAYAAWQHYADSNMWANATLKRLKAWGFTTIGG